MDIHMNRNIYTSSKVIRL